MTGVTSLIERASKEWRSALIDVGGNNRLLFFKSNASTLDLNKVSASGMTRLLSGEVLNLSELFKSSAELEQARKACASLARKQRESLEEFGVPIAFLASGIASWDPEGTKKLADALTDETSDEPESKQGKPKYTRPNAPILLRPVELTRKRGTQDSWTIQLNDDFQLNAVLKHVVNSDAQRLSEDEILELDENTLDSMTQMLDLVEDSCSDIPDFEIVHDYFLGAFSYQKQPMVADIDDLESLANSDLVAALAGEGDAIERVRSIASEINENQPDYSPADSEFLILDADSSQSYVVNAALDGRNLVVEGPPGTGKSQTIANVIAALVANNKKVLFVAQKRAAVSAVLDRLKNVGLESMVLDAFASNSSRRFVAEELRNAIEGQRLAGLPNVSNLHLELEESRNKLVAHNDALHDNSHAWGISIAELRALSLGIPNGSRIDLFLPASVYSDWEDTDLERFARNIDELFATGALSPAWLKTPGWNPNSLTTNDLLQEANTLLRQIQSQELPDVFSVNLKLSKELSFPNPQTWDEVEEMRGILEAIEYVCSFSTPFFSEEFDKDRVDSLRSAIDKQFRKTQTLELSWGQRRKLAKELAVFIPNADKLTKIRILEAASLVWASTVKGNVPQLPAGLAEAQLAWDALRTSTEILQNFLQLIDITEVSFQELKQTCTKLSSQNNRTRMPRAHELEAELEQSQQGPVIRLVEELVSESSHLDFSPGNVLRWVAINSILEDALMRTPEISGVDGNELNAAANAYRKADISHLEANASRVRRLFAEQLKYTLDSFPQQHQILKTEVTRKRNFRTIRNLLTEAPDVMLAAKPVWAMSPLQVSKLLPAYELFDVVIFDEASQIVPADAIPALLRAGQVVVAGDSRQLPPTEFFTKILEDVAPTDAQEIEQLVEEETGSLTDAPAPQAKKQGRADSFTRDAESILFAMDRILAGQSRRLLWHYRSRDERLISVSNAHVYDSSLTTFPAADSPDAIKYVSVPPSKGIKGKTNSPEKEVEAVVNLVIEHYKTHPEESLGVITFGSPHQRRIELALDKAMQADPGLAEWIGGNTAEPFFVKNIERVQGDERDSIILTVGYGKEPNGKLKYFWGPLLKEGGERRLNVAISRAKQRMTLVTSFTPDDVPENGHDSAGFRLMYRFLRFMASGGVELDGGPDYSVPLNPFEIDVRDRLTAAGLNLDPQVGVGSYRIDFAARHPKLPGRHVLAIEADGASYHSGHTARERDRLRQSLLEKRGWVFHRIWSTDWFNDAEHEVQKVLSSYQEALNADNNTSSKKKLAQEKPGDEESVGWHIESAERIIPMPNFYPGNPITEYSPQLLTRIVASIRSDNVLRTKDEELDYVVKLLGFTRKGPRIVKAIEAAQQSATY